MATREGTGGGGGVSAASIADGALGAASVWVDAAVDVGGGGATCMLRAS